MKLPSRSSKLKKLFIPLGVSALFIAGLVFMESVELTDFIKSDKPGPSESEKAQQREADLQSKQDFIESPSPAETETEAPIGIDLSARQEDNGSVTILSKLSNIPEGKCVLSIHNGLKSIDRTADIIYQPDFSSCAGFSIPKNELGEGTWSIHLTVMTGETENEKTITFSVN